MQRSDTDLDIADVPDKVLEALNLVRTLKQAANDDELSLGRALEPRDEIERLLRLVLKMLTAAAEQFAEAA